MTGAISVVALAGVLVTSDASAQEIGPIQGAGHVSPLVGQSVTTTGVVTALAFGFYLQDAEGDHDDTSRMASSRSPARVRASRSATWSR